MRGDIIAEYHQYNNQLTFPDAGFHELSITFKTEKESEKRREHNSHGDYMLGVPLL